MNEIQNEAIAKIRGERTVPKKREHVYIMPFIADALCSFIEQSADFASAVMADGKTLCGCVESMKLEGQAFSDVEAYKAAVRYFFPDATVEYSMAVKVPKSQTSAKILDIRFEDLFNI